MQRRLKERRAQNNSDYIFRNDDWLDEPRIMGMFKEQPKRCAKPCCGSQRYWHGPRWQEQRGIILGAIDIASGE